MRDAVVLQGKALQVRKAVYGVADLANLVVLHAERAQLRQGGNSFAEVR